MISEPGEKVIEKRFKIGEVAKLTGLDPKTIRYYEAIRVIPNARRTAVPHGLGYRLFSNEDVRRLTFVKQAKMLGLSLGEIRELVTVAEEGCCTSLNPKVGLLIDRKLSEINNRITELGALRRSLRRLQAQFREGLVKPQRRQKELVIFHVPCRDDTCADGVTSTRKGGESR